LGEEAVFATIPAKFEDIAIHLEIFTIKLVELQSVTKRFIKDWRQKNMR
jgi:hypothetical protein